MVVGLRRSGSPKVPVVGEKGPFITKYCTRRTVHGVPLDGSEDTKP